MANGVVRSEIGVGFILVLMMAGAVTLFAVPLVTIGSSSLLAARHADATLLERYAVDAGVEEALWKIKWQEAPEFSKSVSYDYSRNYNNLATSVTIDPAPLPTPMVSGPEYIVEPPPIIDTEPGGHISISETVYPNYLAPQNSPETFWFTIHILNQGTSTVHMTEFGSCLPEHFTYFSPETQGVTGVTDLYLGGSETSVDKQDSTLLTAEEMNDPALNPEFIQTKTINNPYCPADRWQIRWNFKKDVKIFSGDTAKITYKATATQLLPGVHCNQVFVEPNPSSYNGYVTNNACNLVAAWPEWNITASADGTTAEVRAELQHPDEWEEAVTIKSWQVGGGSPAEPLVNGVHVGDLEGNGWAPKGKPGFWSARARIYVHDANHDPVGGAVVKGVFHQTELGFVSEEFSCTSSLGICDIVNDRGLSELQTTALFEVREITLEPMNYDLTSNHDQDGFDSDGRILEIIYK